MIHPAPSRGLEPCFENDGNNRPGIAVGRRPSSVTAWLDKELDAKEAKRAAVERGLRRRKTSAEPPARESATHEQHHTVDVASDEDGAKEPQDPEEEDPRTPQDDLHDVLEDRKDRRRSRLKWCIWISTAVLLFMLVGAATIMVAVPAVVDWRDDNSLKVGGAKLYKWLYLAAGMVASGILAHLIVPPVVSLITNNLLLMPSLVYVLRPLRNSMALTLHAAFCAILWWLIFGLTIDAIDEDVYLMGKRILLCIFCFALARLIKGVLGKMAAMRFRRDSYFASMKKALAKEFFLQALCTASSTPFDKARRTFSSYAPFLSNDDGSDEEDEPEEKDAASKADRKNAKDEDSRDPDKAAKLENYINKYKLTDTFAPSIVGKERPTHRLSEQARVLTEHMWMNVQAEKEAPTENIERGDLEPFLPVRLAAQAFKMFDVKGTGFVSKEELQENVRLILQERSNLQHTLRDNTGVVAKLESCVGFILYVIAAAASLIIFRVDIYALFLTISSMTVAASFVFGASLQLMFESLIYVLVVRPFDVGNQLLIGKMPHRVIKIQLLSTGMRRWNGERVYYPNSELMKQPIVNMSHSASRWEGISLIVDHSTPMEKIAKLRIMCDEFLAAHPEHFLQTKRASVRLRDCNHPLKITLSGKFTIRNNGADVGATSNARDLFLEFFCGAVASLNMSYLLPPVAVDGIPIDGGAAYQNEGGVDNGQEGQEGMENMEGMEGMDAGAQDIPTGEDLSTDTTGVKIPGLEAFESW